MKKIYCPVCKTKWRKGDNLDVRIAGAGEYIATDIKIEDVVFCPRCLFGSRMASEFRAKGKQVVLQEDNMKLSHIVCLDEFGEYVETPVEKLRGEDGRMSRFDPSPNDDSGDNSKTRPEGARPDGVPEGARQRGYLWKW